MSEMAEFNGERIKIGTCENMYYLRADQAGKVRALYGNVDPSSNADRKVIRFRFPFPDEDEIQPGSFDNYSRAITIPGGELKVPSDLEHYSVQFSFRKGGFGGWLLSLPCPLSSAFPADLGVFRNGCSDSPEISQQGFRGGALVTIANCPACGALYRLDVEDARIAADAFKREGSVFFSKIADRIIAGYAGYVEVPR